MTTLRTERRGRFVLSVIPEGSGYDIHLALHDANGFHVFAVVVADVVSLEVAMIRFDEILEALPGEKPAADPVNGQLLEALRRLVGIIDRHNPSLPLGGGDSIEMRQSTAMDEARTAIAAAEGGAK